jgi:uncharacterized membrane protein
MRNFNKVDLIIFVLFLLFAIPAGIFIALSGINNNDSNDSNDSKFSGTYFWIGLVLSIIAAIFMLVFLVRTGINLSEPTITNTNIRGVQQISPGVKLF